MPARRKPRPLDAVLADIEEPTGAAHELVQRGRAAWDDDRLLRLAGESLIGRIADATNRLPDQVKRGIPDVPWDDIRDIRILVDHIYHRIDYRALWKTLKDDIPHLLQQLRAWSEGNLPRSRGQDARRVT